MKRTIILISLLCFSLPSFAAPAKARKAKKPVAVEASTLQQCKENLESWLKQTLSLRQGLQGDDLETVTKIMNSLKKPSKKDFEMELLELNDELALRQKMEDKIAFCHRLQVEAYSLSTDWLAQVKSEREAGKKVPQTFYERMEDIVEKAKSAN